MAIMKPSLPAAISGRLVGLEFAVAKNGIVVKHRKPPRRMNSRREVNARTVFARRVSDWDAMTREAALEWNAYAATHPVINRLGQTRYLSGYNWFHKLRGTLEGILLPFGTTQQCILGDPVVYEGGPYYFPITWPSGAEDDSTISVWFGGIKYYLDEFPKNMLYGGTYTKAETDDLNYYDALTALGIAFVPNHHYFIKAVIRRPRYWPSIPSYSYFYVIGYSTWWLKMNDNFSSPTVQDAQNNYPQIFTDPTGDPNTNAHSVPGVHETALYFDGVDDCINLTAESYKPYLAAGTDFTLCLWWKPALPITNDWCDFLSNYYYHRGGLAFSIRALQSQISLVIGTLADHVYLNWTWTETPVSIWQHWALVRTGQKVDIYKNGILGYTDTDPANTGVMYTTGNPLSIGSRRGIEDFANGAADDVRLYRIGLTGPEIAALATP